MLKMNLSHISNKRSLIKVKRWIYVLGLLTLVITLSACGTPNTEEDNEQTGENDAEEASLIEDSHSEKAGSSQIVQVDLKNEGGEEIGTASLKQEAKGVEIQIEVRNLPKGTHGFHIHEKGLCEEPEFKSAGGHFNPTNAKHGFDNPKGPHAGDLPNLEVGEDGKGTESYLNEMITLKKGEKNSIIREGGTSLMIHSDADDYVSQPAGNAGERIACGVISE